MDKLNGCIFGWGWWLLNKYNAIWDKVSTDIKKNLIASLSIIKTKIRKSFGDEETDFYNK